MRRLLALIGALLLAACDGELMSEIPVIAATELSAPADFVGSYWTLDVKGDALAAQIGQWRWGEGKRGFIEGWGEQNSVRLVDLTGTGLYLVISDQEKNISEYFLLQSRENGIFELDHIAVPYGKFTDEVAARHGVGFPNAQNKIEGLGQTFPGEAIPRLFKDPDFLGTLTFTPATYFMPVSKEVGPIEKAIELLVATRDGLHLTLIDSKVPAAVALEQPKGLGGSYFVIDTHMANWGDTFFEGQPVELRPLSDGHFELHESDEWNDEPEALGRIGLEIIPLEDFFEVQYRQDGSVRLASPLERISESTSFSFPFFLNGERVHLSVEDNRTFKLTNWSTQENHPLDANELQQVLSNGVSGSFIGIYEPPIVEGQEPDGDRKIIGVSQNISGCWAFTVIQQKPDSGAPELNAMRAKLMEDAAARNSLEYDHVSGKISGAHDLRQIKSLLDDSRFNHGTTNEGVFTLCPRIED